MSDHNQSSSSASEKSNREKNKQNYTAFLPHIFWQQLNLKVKTAVLALIIGVFPIAVVGNIAYALLQSSTQKQIKQAQLQRNQVMATRFSNFLYVSFHEAMSLAEEQIFTNPELRNLTTPVQKRETLNRYNHALEVYDNIIFFDVRGNPLFQTQSDNPLPDNYSDRQAFQQALSTKQIVFNEPGLSSDHEDISIEFIAPIQDDITGEVIGILSLKIGEEQIYKLFEEQTQNRDEWQLINSEGIVVAGIETDEIEEETEEDSDDEYHLLEPIGKYFPAIAKLHSAKESGIKLYDNEQENEQELISYVPLPIKDKDLQADEPDEHKSTVEAELEQKIALMGTMIKNNYSVAFESLNQFRLILLIGASLTTFLVIFLAVYLSEYLTRPIFDTANAVEKLGQGELDTRIEISRQKEFARLGININQMAERIQQLLREQEKAAEESMKAQIAIAEQERQQNEALQAELLEFLGNVEEVSNGNLTVRVDITQSQMGIVADFFNSIIENLRHLITQVKEATNKVNYSVGDNEIAIRQVATEALQQAEQIQQTLNALETMTYSIQEVASNAQQAAKVSRTASQSAELGGKAIEQTFKSILQLRETVAATAKKVKRLGESSQEISKVISLINQIAMQTNMLAINASIEASRAGEEGRGFAVVAEEVGELAIKSAEATQEIEEIVEIIQEETADVVAAMELGTSQVVEGTKLVEDTKQSLDRIVLVSQQIDRLLQSISGATISQAQTSQSLSQLMKEVAKVSQRTSDASRNVCDSLDETVKIAQNLETSINIFKV